MAGGTPLEDVVTPPSDVLTPGIQGREDNPPPPPSGEPGVQLSGPELDLDTQAGTQAVPGTLDQMPTRLGPSLTPEQKIRIKRLQAEHEMQYARTILNPAEEAQFQRDLRNSEWAKGFRAQFGTLPDPNDASYDYRGAWKQKLIPERAGQHWPDRAPNGQWLKSPDHPAAWMEYYQNATGRDPEEDNVDTGKFNEMLFGPMVKGEGRRLPGAEAPLDQQANAAGRPAMPSPDEILQDIRTSAATMGVTPEQVKNDPKVALDLLGTVMGKYGIKPPAQPQKPQYTKEELEYMQGAGVKPGEGAPPTGAPAAAPPPGAPAAAPAAPTKRGTDLDKMIEESEKGKGPGTLGQQWKKRSKLKKREKSEVV